MSPVATADPVCLYLETTNRCNLLCTTCPRTYADLEPQADMSWELFTRIVDQVPNIARVVLHGVGEPMLVKDLPRMVRYLKDRGAYVLFNTNGTVLTPRRAASSPSPASTSCASRSMPPTRAPSCWSAARTTSIASCATSRAFTEMQAREGLERPRVSLWLTGLKETIAQLPDFVRIAHDIGVKEVYLQRLVFCEDAPIGMARPDQALFERLTQEEAHHLAAAESAGRRPRDQLQRLRGHRARRKPRAQGRHEPLVAVPAALDGDVLHRQRPGAAVLHRAVLAEGLRELHAGRRHAADACGKSGTARPIGTSARRCSPTRRPRPARAAGCAGAFSSSWSLPLPAQSQPPAWRYQRLRGELPCSPATPNPSAIKRRRILPLVLYPLRVTSSMPT